MLVSFGFSLKGPEFSMFIRNMTNLYKKFIIHESDQSVGLDIGNSSVKVVQLRKDSNSKTKELLNFACQSLKSEKRKDIIEAIKQVMQAAKIESRKVNTSVSGQSVVVRYIQMPHMKKEELAKALKLGVGKYIPFNLDDVNYDFQILENISKDEKTIRVLLVAAKKGIIDERMNILQEAGLIPNIIDVDSFAIVNSFQLVSQQNRGIVAVLDVGADITSTTILLDNDPCFNRDVPIGGGHLTEAIIEEFEMTYAEADKFKQDPGGKYGDLINAVRPVLDSLVREIHMSFNYCESQLGGSVQKIFLTGGTAKFKGIDKVLNGILGVDVEVWDPTRMLEINPSVSQEKLASIGPLLTVSVGLALRG